MSVVRDSLVPPGSVPRDVQAIDEAGLFVPSDSAGTRCSQRASAGVRQDGSRSGKDMESASPIQIYLARKTTEQEPLRGMEASVPITMTMTSTRNTQEPDEPELPPLPLFLQPPVSER